MKGEKFTNDQNMVLSSMQKQMKKTENVPKKRQMKKIIFIKKKRRNMVGRGLTGKFNKN